MKKIFSLVVVTIILLLTFCYASSGDKTYDDGYREGKDGYLENSSYKGNSIVDALKQIGVDASFSNRKKIASRNNISNYTGTATQNIKLLNLLKKGKLIK